MPAKTLFRHLTLSSLELSEARALHISTSQGTELKERVQGFVYCRSQSLLPSVMIFEPPRKKGWSGVMVMGQVTQQPQTRSCLLPCTCSPPKTLQSPQGTSGYSLLSRENPPCKPIAARQRC